MREIDVDRQTDWESERMRDSDLGWQGFFKGQATTDDGPAEFLRGRPAKQLIYNTWRN